MKHPISLFCVHNSPSDRLTPYIPEDSDAPEIKKWEEDFAKAANDIEAINKRKK